MKPSILISAGTAPAVRYLAALEAAGCRPTAAYLPHADPRWDGLVLAGGGDVDPVRYGELCQGSTAIDPDRDACELELLDAFAAWGKPVLGICRGLQVLNVWAGGTLVQDLGDLVPGHQRAGGDLPHPVYPVPGSVLHRLYGDQFLCGSAHHQAIAQLGHGLTVTGTAPDGVIEGADHDTLPILAVQFHPERMFPPETADGGVLFRHFAALFSPGPGGRRPE